MKDKVNVKQYAIDTLVAVIAGLIVSVAYYFFQNSNGFAPGGVGGLATITHHFLGGRVDWAILMISFNLFGNGLRDAFNPALRGVED